MILHLKNINRSNNQDDPDDKNINTQSKINSKPSISNVYTTREEPKNASKHKDKSLHVGEIKPMEEDYVIPFSDVISHIPTFDVLFKECLNQEQICITKKNFQHLQKSLPRIILLKRKICLTK